MTPGRNEPSPPDAIAYATPSINAARLTAELPVAAPVEMAELPAPRRSVALCVAAGVVWYGAFSLARLGVRIIVENPGDVPFALLGGCTTITAVGIAWAEWRALVRRSDAAAALVMLVTLVASAGWLIVTASAWRDAMLAPEPIAENPDRARLAVLTAILLAAALVATTHGLWAGRLRTRELWASRGPRPALPVKDERAREA